MKKITDEGFIEDQRNFKTFLYEIYTTNDGREKTVTYVIVTDTEEHRAVNLLEKALKQQIDFYRTEYNLEEDQELKFSRVNCKGFHNYNLVSYGGDRIGYENFYKITYDLVCLDTEYDYVVKTRKYLQEGEDLEDAMERFKVQMAESGIKNIEVKGINKLKYNITDVI